MGFSQLVSDNNLGFMYIAEETNTMNRVVTNVDCYNQNGVFYVEFDTILHTFNEINRNQRMYLADNIRECINTDDRIISLLEDNAWYGEMDHPSNETNENTLTPKRVRSIYMPNRSHKIMRPKFVGDTLQAHIQTASGTDAGAGFAKEIIQGLHPAFSCRAIALLQMINGKPTVVVRKLITYDWVLYPSHKRAHAISVPHGVTKSIPIVATESVDDDIITATMAKKDIMIPLTEILESVGTTDYNTQVLLESFELSLDSLVGFDETRTHTIIKDANDNMIYAKINPSTKRKVDDFFSSFNL